MPDNATYDAFLSHSHQDAEIAEALAKRLEDDAGLRIWLDKWVLVPGPLSWTEIKGVEHTTVNRRA